MNMYVSHWLNMLFFKDCYSLLPVYCFGRKSDKPKWPAAAILWKYDEKACALYNLIKNALINFIFDVSTDML